MNNFYLIGLTGNLGSGKSTIRKMLEQLGARGIDADALAHVAMARGTSTWRAIVEAFGADVLAFNGRVDRQKLSARVFADGDGLRKLETIVHPAVGALTRQMLREAQEPVVVIEAIKLIEAGMHFWCDAVWVVKCEPEVQIERVMRDRQMSQPDARARLAAQGPLEDKLRFAHVVIDNSGDEDATRAEVEQAWRAIRREDARDKTTWLFDLPRQEPVSPIAEAQPPTVLVEEPAPPPMPVWATAKPIAPVAEPLGDQMPGIALTPQVPAWANVEADVQVRRARRSDLDALSAALAKIDNRSKPLSRAETLKRFGERGYRIAIADKRIVAVAAWQAENLVAIVREIWTESADTAPIALPKLFGLIEKEAKELLCEVVVLLINEGALTLSAEAHSIGYKQSEMHALHPVWQGVAREYLRPSDQLWVKRLREGITTKPV